MTSTGVTMGSAGKASPHLAFVADVNGPGLFHLGDEAMLEANLLALRELIPGARFTVLSGDPEWTSNRYDVQSIRTPVIPSVRLTESGVGAIADSAESEPPHEDLLGAEVIEVLRTCDGLIVSGGGNLCATWPDKIVTCGVILQAASHLGIPSVVLSQTMGPRLTGAQRRLLSKALPLAAWIGVRDEASRAVLETLGVPGERIYKHIDDAYLLRAVRLPPDVAQRLQGVTKPWILVTLDASFTSPERKRGLPSLASQLQSLAMSIGGSLLFVPHVSGVQAADSYADTITGDLLASELGGQLAVLAPLQPAEFRELVGQAAIVVSTRYHSVVFAMAAGVPCLGIYTDAYTKVKLKGALGHAELDCWCIPLDEAVAGTLFPLAVEQLHQSESVAARLRELRVELAAREDDRWRKICQALRLEPQGGMEIHGGTPAAGAAAIPPRNDRVAWPEIRESQWQEYAAKGYLRLGCVLSPEQLGAVQMRLNEIMLKRVEYPTLLAQLDTGGAYEALPDPVSGLPEVTLAYRKIQGLEADPLVLDLIRRPIFREICAHHYGKHASVSIFRVMMMNKPARQGTYLPWHQDAGDIWRLDRDPEVTTWVALDPATRANGCVQIIPGSHRLGLLSKRGSTISQADVDRYCRDEEVEYLELEPGEALLLHNWLLHRSDINQTDSPRRALSVCYMDARTLNVTTGRHFPVIFGEPQDAETAQPFVTGVLREMEELRERLAESQQYSLSLLERHRALEGMLSEAERYTSSLLDDNRKREEMRLETEKYAKSLEAELLIGRSEEQN